MCLCVNIQNTQGPRLGPAGLCFVMPDSPVVSARPNFRPLQKDSGHAHRGLFSTRHTSSSTDGLRSWAVSGSSKSTQLWRSAVSYGHEWALMRRPTWSRTTMQDAFGRCLIETMKSVAKQAHPITHHHVAGPSTAPKLSLGTVNTEALWRYSAVFTTLPYKRTEVLWQGAC